MLTIKAVEANADMHPVIDGAIMRDSTFVLLRLACMLLNSLVFIMTDCDKCQIMFFYSFAADLFLS